MDCMLVKVETSVQCLGKLHWSAQAVYCKSDMLHKLYTAGMKNLSTC
jgi:hypothetical protein